MIKVKIIAEKELADGIKEARQSENEAEEMNQNEEDATLKMFDESGCHSDGFGYVSNILLEAVKNLDDLLKQYFLIRMEILNQEDNLLKISKDIQRSPVNYDRKYVDYLLYNIKKIKYM